MSRMAIAGNQTDIGYGKLSFFRSFIPGGTNNCLVMAHGSWTANDGMFRVPAHRTPPGNVNVHFYTAHGEALSGRSSRHIASRTYAVMRDQVLPHLVTHTTGDDCNNYSLQKVMGRHENPRDAGAGSTYRDLEGYMRQAASAVSGATPDLFNAWAPHIVTVRHSRIGFMNHIALETLITRVLDHQPNVTDFYVAACRVEFRNGQRCYA